MTPFVEVEWWDAFALGAWSTSVELQERLDKWIPERTRGFLVHSEGETLVLAMNESDPFLNCQAIPKCCVVRVRRV
jgi:hypothetical protein